MSEQDPFRAAMQLAKVEIRRAAIIECANVVNRQMRQTKNGEPVIPTLNDTERQIMNLIYVRSET